MGKDLYSKSDDKEFFPTQEFVKNDLYEQIDKYFETKLKNDRLKIIDPCCGDGGLEKFNDKYLYKLYDIEDHGVCATICDFLKEPYDEQRYDCAVINPPFGLTVEFIKRALLYTNDIFLIAPAKTVIKNFSEYIKWFSFKIEYSYKCFGIMTTVGLFHLHFKPTTFRFGPVIKPTKESFFGPQIDTKDSWKEHFHRVNKAPAKYFIVDRLTKARVVRFEPFIRDEDLYSPNDDNAFIAVAGNINIKAGDRVERNICEFDTFEEMKAFQTFYNSHDKELREYMYKNGDTILKGKQKPFLTAQNSDVMLRILTGECSG